LLSTLYSATPSLGRPAVAPSAGSGDPRRTEDSEKFSSRAPFGRTLSHREASSPVVRGGFPTVKIIQTFPGIESAMSTAHDSTDGGAVAATSAAASLAEDRELIALFVSRRDFAAFQALVERHAEMVLGVCRRVLQQTQDAEDACQAVFLIL